MKSSKKRQRSLAEERFKLFPDVAATCTPTTPCSVCRNVAAFPDGLQARTLAASILSMATTSTLPAELGTSTNLHLCTWALLSTSRPDRPALRSLLDCSELSDEDTALILAWYVRSPFLNPSNSSDSSNAMCAFLTFDTARGVQTPMRDSLVARALEAYIRRDFTLASKFAPLLYSLPEAPLFDQVRAVLEHSSNLTEMTQVLTDLRNETSGVQEVFQTLTRDLEKIPAAEVLILARLASV